MISFTKNQHVHYILQNSIHSDLLVPSLTPKSTKKGGTQGAMKTESILQHSRLPQVPPILV